MGIKIFIYSLFLIALGAHYYQIDIEVDNTKKEERPLLTFNGATMYTIDDKQVQRIVQTNDVAIYKDREELFETVMVERSNSSAENDFTDTIRANYLEKKGDFITMRGDVKYNRSSFMTLNSDELFYDLNKKIGYNDKAFEMIYEGQRLTGTHIYFDSNSRIFKANNTHFEIELKDNNETN